MLNRGQGIGLLMVMLVTLLIAGCAGGPDSGKGNEAGAGSSQVSSKAGSTSPAEPVEAANPYNIRSFLDDLEKENGDIYLGEDTLHVNIVNLDEAAEQSFAQRFTAGSYVLHDVKYSIQELNEAMDRLADQQMMKKLDIYSATLDVINNCIEISLPEEAGTAPLEELYAVMEPEMLKITVKELGSPEVTGEIVAIEDKNGSILIQEPDKEIPTYWFSFNTASRIVNNAGEPLAAADLEIGDSVRLWSTGSIMESLPAQATVRRLELATP